MGTDVLFQFKHSKTDCTSLMCCTGFFKSLYWLHNNWLHKSKTALT